MLEALITELEAIEDLRCGRKISIGSSTSW
jgi:hypothetical protein